MTTAYRLMQRGHNVALYEATPYLGGLVRTIVEKLFTFAIGRGPEYYDAPTIRQIVRDIEKSDYQWSSLVLALVKSTPFQMRRVGETPLVAAATAPRRADQ